MKILLLGAGGLLGRHLRTHFSNCGHQLLAQTRAQADITDTRAMTRLLTTEPWDAVVNAAAICNFDACEADPEGTGQVNYDAPLDLARHCADNGALFVQFSSDYIFDGKSTRFLTEEDPPAPLSVYGRQKATLERDIPMRCPRSLLLRLSWLYGIGGNTFMSLLPGLLSSRKTLDVASGKKGTCLYAHDAALWIERLVVAGETGLFHLVNPGETSWEEFARHCAHRMNRTPDGIREVPYESLGLSWAKRPRWSCLDPSKLSRTLPPGPRPWAEALDAFLLEWKSVAARGRV